MSVDELTSSVTVSFYRNRSLTSKSRFATYLCSQHWWVSPFSTSMVLSRRMRQPTSLGLAMVWPRARFVNIVRIVTESLMAARGLRFHGIAFRHTSQFCEVGHNITGDRMIMSHTKLDSRTLWPQQRTLCCTGQSWNSQCAPQTRQS